MGGDDELHGEGGRSMLMGLLAVPSAGDGARMMRWNKQPIPVEVALQIGWNLPIDVVGAGVYGGIVKRDEAGRVMIGDEWPENNRAPPAHNPVHGTGPYLDFSKFTPGNRGYAHIASVIMTGNAVKLDALLQSAGNESERAKLANIVMTGGARPLHMCGMSRGGDASELIKTLVKHGADVNAKDNYELTPVDRLSSNFVSGNEVLRNHGAIPGHQAPAGVPRWDSDAFVYAGPGEA